MNKNCTKQTPFSMNTFLQKSGGLKALMLLVLLQILGSATYAQTIKVTGTVTDVKGEPLPGVSVKLKGTAVGTSTAANGKYSLMVPGSSSVLSFTFIGYVHQDQTVGAKTIINIKMAEDQSSLDEIVVTGYGQSVKKRDLTGSISSVSSKDIEERQPVTLFDALQGMAAGVLVTNDSGDPAGQGTIQIRGASTINAEGNGPLYIIDGIMSADAEFVNPTDIESIEILKDASSTAIYGARGANGVILITTKSGKDGKPLINGTYTSTYAKLAHKLRTTTADELRMYRAYRGNGNGASVDSLNPYLNADNDFQDLLFRTGRKQVMNLSLSGGKSGNKYYGSLNYLNNDAIILNSRLKRLQAKVNVDNKLTSNLKISNNLAFAYQNGNEIPVGNTAKQVFEKNPWTSIYRPDGSLAGYVESKRNPVAYALLYQDVDNNYTAQYNMRVEYDFLKSLKFTTLFNGTLNSNSTDTFSPASLTQGGTGDATGTNFFYRKFGWEYQAFLTYNRTFGKDHVFSALGGFSADRNKTDTYNVGMFNYLSEAINTSNAGTIDLTKVRTAANAASSASFFSRANYSFKGKYLAQTSYRRDGSSKFGVNNQYGNFFSGSAAWRFSDEKFMSWSKKFLVDAKLRYSIGQTGNDAISGAAQYTLMDFGEQYYNGYSAAAESISMGNSKVQWESATMSDIGLDLTLLKGRMTFTADYYSKITANLLYNNEIPKEAGKSKSVINLGKIQNTGLEFTLGGTPVSNKNFSWNVTGNISFTKGIVKELANHVPYQAGNIFYLYEGGSIGDMYVWKNLGVYQYDVSNAYDAQGRKLTPEGITINTEKNTSTAAGYSLNGQPYTGTVYQKKRNGVVLQGGDTEWLDVNNDGIIDDSDIVIGGNGIPKYFFGFNNTFRYKRFSLNFLFNGQVGNSIYNAVKNGQNTNSSTYSPPTYDAILGSWQKQGDIAQYPLFTRKDDRGSIKNGYNSLYIEDGTFIRLSSVRLSYSVNPKLLTKVGVKSAQIYLFGTNLATWTNYSWYDPEFSSKTLEIGVDNGKYPKMREAGFGINVNF